MRRNGALLAIALVGASAFWLWSPEEVVAPPGAPTAEAEGAPSRSTSAAGPDDAGAAGRADPGLADLAAGRGTLCGLVLEEGTDRPVPEAQVALQRAGGGRFEVYTDDDGRFCASALPPGAFALVARAGGRLSETLEGVPLEAGEELRELVLTLEPGVSVSGRVRDRLTGEPVAGARITVRCAAGPMVASSTADRAGDYRVEVGPGSHLLEVQAAGYARREVSLEVAGPRPLSGVDLLLDPGATVSGRVLAPDGRPVPGASVQALAYRLRSWAGPREPAAEAVADAEGRYTIHGPPGSLTLIARADGFGPARVDAVEAGPGAEVEADLRLTEESGLRVEVLGSDGAPVPGASVAAWCDGELACGSAVADATGRARLGNLPAGTVQVQASAPSRGEARVDVELAAGVVRRLSVALSGTGWLAGTVSGEDGRPVAGAEVRLSPETGGGAPRLLRTDAEGAFQAEVPVSAPFTVRAEAPSLGAAELPGRQAGDRVTLVLSRPGRLVGWVTDHAGRPVTDFTVAVVPGLDTSARGYRRQRFAAESGDFAFDDLPPGAYRVRAGAPGHAAAAPVDVQVDAGAESGPVRLVLGAAGRIRGRVVDPEGRPVQGARVSHQRGRIHGLDRWSGEGAPPVESGADGSFLLADVPAGRRHRVFAWLPERMVGASAPVQVEPQVEAGPVVVRMRRLPGHGGPDPDTFGGIGMSIGVDEAGRVSVFRVFEGGPAFLAGLRPGDLLLAVDGVPTAGLGLRGSLDAVRGPVGSPVTMLVERRSGEPVTVRVVRVRLQL